MRPLFGFLEKIAHLTVERNRHEKSKLSENQICSSLQLGHIDGRALHSTHSLANALRNGSGFISEIKRASPSQGMIAHHANAIAIADDYLKHGASAISVLTEPHHFGGSLDDLVSVRAAHPNAVLLMKDFVIDPYQIYQARYFGADAVLLIVAMLNEAQLREMHDLATSLGLSVLVEVHDETEFEIANSIRAPIIGINNRNLKTLETDLKISKSLCRLAQPGTLLVAESGIENRETILELRDLGFEGFLVGTSLMREASPGLALQRLAAR